MPSRKIQIYSRITSRRFWRKYFDPKGGEFPQRIDRLVRRDGELEALLSRHVNGDGSTLSQTLDKHLGPTSPLLKLLSPEQQQGLLACLKDSLTAVIINHGRQIAGQFSLDEKDSALSRLGRGHNREERFLASGSRQRHRNRPKRVLLGQPRWCFSRDSSLSSNRPTRRSSTSSQSRTPTSALVRMLELLKATNDAVERALTLDDDGSPLSRLRRG